MTITCPLCQQTKETALTPKGVPRPPRGWKHIGAALLCPTCVKQGYRILSVTVPIAGPVDRSWIEFGAALREAWAETTRCANWLATELYARDVRREPGDAKLRPMPRVYLYPEARAAFPAISPINLTALIQQVEQTYRKRRYELLWQRSISLPTYRYPVPTPLHAQAWRLEATDGGAQIAHVRLGETWWALRLRSGPHFHRQRAQIDQIRSGLAIGQAGALYAIGAVGDTQTGDARHAERGRRVILKLVAWFPRVERVASAAVATVQTSGSDLLLVRVPGRGIVHSERGDHLRRAIAGYEIRRARLSADLAVVRRWRADERQALLARLETIATHQRRAVKTWLQEAASHVARACRLAGCGAVSYEDEAQEWCAPFPWQALRLAVQHACEGQGLSWTYASGRTGATDEEVAREPVSVEVSA